MVFIDLLFVAVVAMVLTALVIGAIGWRAPGRDDAGGAALFMFFLIFLVVWAIGSWTTPYGPMLWGGYWLPYVVIGVFVVLVVLAVGASAAEDRPRRLRKRPPAGPPNNTTTTTAPATSDPTETAQAGAVVALFGIFFWILMVVAVISIVVRYLV